MYFYNFLIGMLSIQWLEWLHCGKWSQSKQYLGLFILSALSQASPKMSLFPRHCRRCIFTVTSKWTACSFFKSGLLFLSSPPPSSTCSNLLLLQVKKKPCALTERTTAAAHCPLETKPLITAVPLMNKTYPTEREKEKEKEKKTPLI